MRAWTIFAHVLAAAAVTSVLIVTGIWFLAQWAVRDLDFSIDPC